MIEPVKYYNGNTISHEKVPSSNRYAKIITHS